jgi:CheY-like chemotaxis protein
MPEMDGFMLAGEIMRRPGLEGTPLIMLTSAGQTRDCERRRALGIRACLTKPAKQSDLLQAIIKTLGQSPQSVTRPALSAQTAPTTGGKAMRILLAEDNVVNQRLAVRLLEKHGHTVLVTNNGGEAIAALEREPFDLALMDVQMPEMSGLEATARIRERERATGARLPIIALTAYAMKGDRERCLEAGMDGYVSKPIQSAELFKLVAELTPIEQVARQAGKSEEQAEEVFDRAAALSLAGGDQELLAELAELFAADCLRLLTELGQAIARGESKGVECVAHTLAGTASNFGGRRVAVLARQLEELGRAENVIEAKPYYALLEVEVKQLTSALGALVGKNPGWKPGGGEPVAV